jgi:protein TonB
MDFSIIAAEPARRRRQGRDEDWRIAAALAAALLLHAGLLAALISGRPAALQPAPQRAVVSLLVQAPAAAIAPRPAQTPMQVPPMAARRIADAMPVPADRRRPSPPALISRPARQPAPASAPAPTPSGSLVQSQAAPRNTAPDSQGFVAAAPLSGAFNQPPEYPQAAIDHDEQGSVLLSIHVLANGLTDFVAVTQGSGFRLLDQAAADAVMKWRFQPATMGGKPVVQVIPFWFHFDLSRQRVQPGSPQN